MIKDTIAKGVKTGQIAYVGKSASGDYQPFLYNVSLNASDVEIADEVFIITRETAEAYQKAKETPRPVEPIVSSVNDQGGRYQVDPTPIAPVTPVVEVPVTGRGLPTGTLATQLMWTGEIPPQKWMNFYTKVLTRFATTKGLRIKIDFEVSQIEGISEQKVEETKIALRELGLEDDVAVK